jgi:hypothetical protein
VSGRCFSCVAGFPFTVRLLHPLSRSAPQPPASSFTTPLANRRKFRVNSKSVASQTRCLFTLHLYQFSGNAWPWISFLWIIYRHVRFYLISLQQGHSTPPCSRHARIVSLLLYIPCAPLWNLSPMNWGLEDDGVKCCPFPWYWFSVKYGKRNGFVTLCNFFLHNWAICDGNNPLSPLFAFLALFVCYYNQKLDMCTRILWNSVSFRKKRRLLSSTTDNAALLLHHLISQRSSKETMGQVEKYIIRLAMFTKDRTTNFFSSSFFICNCYIYDK